MGSLSFQSDALLSLLQQLTAESGGIKPEAQTDTSSTTLFTEHSSSGANFGEVPQDTGLVGPTAAELESLNELIKFDHIYYKEEPPAPSASSTSNSSSNTMCSGSLEPSLVLSSTVKKVLPVSVRPKTVSSGQMLVASCEEDLGIGSIVLTTGSSMWDNTNNNMVSLLPKAADGLLESVPKPTGKDISKQDMGYDMEYDPSAEFLDFESLLGLAELETSEIQLQDPSLHNQQQTQEHPVRSEPQQQVMNVGTNIVVMGDKTPTRKRKRNPSKGSTPPSPKKDVSSFEILSFRDLSVYEDTPQENLSDSGMSSDLSDAPSPSSDISSVLGDDTWEESFTELFPSLL